MSLLAACAPSARPATASPAYADASREPRSETPERTLQEVMRDHFSDATAARDAVIAGRLDMVQPALQRLAAREPGSDTPADWLAFLDDMKAAAAHGSRVATLDGSAKTVADLGTRCGDCHRATRGGRRQPSHLGGYSAGQSAGIAEKMQRHQFSADELWAGLTGPSHQDWSQGAAALMNILVPGLVTHRGEPAAQERLPTGEGSLQGPTSSYTAPESEPAPPGVVDLDAAMRELRELGRVADRARTASEKQDVFAKIIVRCGECHRELGVRLL